MANSTKKTMEPLKHMFSPALLQSIGDRLKSEYPSFDTALWMAQFSTYEWNAAELKQRVNLVARAFYHTLPQDYNKAISILKPVSQCMYYGYAGVVFSEYVALYGRSHWELSMEALAVFTQTSTAEFAIRPFIVDDPAKAMKQMEKWSKHPNHHVRRLSSEGCRPRLPWGMKLQLCIDDPYMTYAILDRLKGDSELYVRKSVANHLNDIAKDHPAVALEFAQAWQGHSPEADWVVRHGLRGLLKSGHAEALALMGQSPSKHIAVTHFGIAKKKLQLGDTLELTVALENKGRKHENLRLEYAIDYVKSTGKTGRKVFQWSMKPIAPGSHQFKKAQRLVNMTTRVHYTGRHSVHVIVNGVVLSSASFDLAVL